MAATIIIYEILIINNRYLYNYDIIYNCKKETINCGDLSTKSIEKYLSKMGGKGEIDLNIFIQD